MTLAVRRWLVPFLGLTLTLSAQQKRIYIAPDDHTDYLWSADEATYRQAFLSMIDYYLDKMDETAGDPSDSQMRWNCDGSLWMWEYQKNRTPAQFERMLSRIKDGHMSVPLNSLVLVQGGAPAEAVIRGMYYPGLIQRKKNVDFPIAIAMENQTLPYGLPSLWAGSGAKYSWKGVCNCASKVTGLKDRDREMYYVGGRDGSRILMKWNSQFNDRFGYGSYAEAPSPMEAITFAENDVPFKAKYPWAIIGAFGTGEDNLQYMSDEYVTTARQNGNADRRIIVSNQEDFFRDFEHSYGTGLETFAASYGNEWDVLVASMAEVSARIKRSTEKLRAAESMATLLSLNEPSFMASRTEARDKAMLDLGLYFEHDWTADGKVSRNARAAWSRVVEAEVTSYVDKLYTDAKAALATQISREGQEQRFFVFNPLSWARTDFADVPLRLNRKVKVVDLTTGREVPSQVIRSGNGLILRVTATNVPSLGYKVYELQSGASGGLPDVPVAGGSAIENSTYRVAVAGDGAITSLIDKAHGNRELVRNIGGHVINDLGGNRSGDVIVENSGPVSTTLRTTSLSPIPHTTRVTLYQDKDRIDISNNITANFGDVKSWSYSFNINAPDVWHEEVGAVIRAKLLTNGGHYSPRNARYDWLTMNHFADMSSGAGDYGVTVSNWDNYFMKLGASTPAALDTATPQINILAGGQIDGSTLGIPNQNGDSDFTQRFALWPHDAFSQSASMRMALEHQNPFVTGSISDVGDQTRAYPATSFSFLKISDPDVMLWSLKPAEDGIDRGIVVRVWNQSDLPTTYAITLASPITTAERLTHIETSIEPAQVFGGRLNAAINQQQMQTHLLKVNSSSRRSAR